MGGDRVEGFSQDALILLDRSARPQVVLDSGGSVLFLNSAARPILGTYAASQQACLHFSSIIEALARHYRLDTSREEWQVGIAMAVNSFEAGVANIRLRAGDKTLNLRCFDWCEGRRVLEVGAAEEASRPTAASLDDRAVMHEMIEYMDHGIVLYDHNEYGEDIVCFFNSKAAELLEVPAGMLRIGMRRRDLTKFCHQRGDHKVDFDMSAYVEAIERGRSAQVLSRRPSGRFVMNSSHPRQKRRGSLTLHVDVTKEVTDQQKLMESRAQYRALAETAPTGIVQVESSGKIVFANAAALQIFGEDMDDIHMEAQVLPQDGSTILSFLGTGERFEAEIIHPYGKRHVIVSTSIWLGEADKRTCIVTFADITPLKEARSQIEHMARHDPLTGLGNRTLFSRTWDDIEDGSAQHWPVHLVALDLDRFKAVNDDFGHGVGDQLLRQVAARIAEAVAPLAVAFRLGGDEFALVMRQVPKSVAVDTAERVVRALAEPFSIGGLTISVGCSAGIATLPQDGSSGEDIQRAADIALYQVKRNGRNGVACFDPEQERELQERRRLEADLALAVAQGDFSLVFQAQFDLQSGRTIAIEAMLRWYNRRLKQFIPPEKFLPIAECTGLVTLIDLWVIRNAIARTRQFVDEGVERPFVSINLSPISLASLDVVDRLSEALQEFDVDPGLIEVEVIEGVGVAQKENVGRTLGAIQAAGMRVAINDFGAGQTSLAFLRSLPIDRVKIDRSIIKGIEDDESARAIVASVQNLCGRLGLRMTAKGVETAEQWEELRTLGAMDAQGHYLGDPESAEVLLARLRSEGRLHRAQTRLRQIS